MDSQDRRIAILTHLAEISVVLNSTLQIDVMLAFLMDTAAEIVSAEAASVLLWNRKRHELYVAATTTSTAALNLIGQTIPLDGSIAGEVMRTQETLLVNDVRADSRHYRQIDSDKGFATRSILCVPLTVRSRPIGVLEVLNKRELPWTEDDPNYLSILAAQASVAIESARQMKRLRRANRDLKELDKLKTHFIAIASHELRTPLGVILGYASFLKETSEGSVNEQATKVMNSALQLRRIIEDMTNLRYLNEGKADLQPAAVPLDTLIQEAAAQAQALCETKGHTLDIKSAPADVTVFVDPIRVGMALNNVLDNAMIFTPPGGQVSVEVNVRSAEAWVIVSDNGNGIAQENMERIFEPFYQVEDHMIRRHGGIGIGLSIARALMRAHNGRIWASSPGPGQGSSFILAFPLAKAGETR